MNVNDAIPGAIQTITSFGEGLGGGEGGDIDYLKRKNPLPSLDNFFRFDDSIDPATGEKRHEYYISDEYGERRYHGSCTGLIHEYVRPFDREAAYAAMERNGRFMDPDDEYFGMTKKQVFAQWTTTGVEASGHGTVMHAEIEKFYNNCTDWLSGEPWIESKDTNPSLMRFLAFHADKVVRGGMVPFRTEVNLFDEMFEFAGQCDIILQRSEWVNDPERKNWIVLGDWKQTKKDLLGQQPFRGETMLGCCSSLKRIQLNEYRLQLSLYGLILQRRTSLIVKEMYIGVFHKNNTTYQWIPIEPEYEIAAQMLVERRQSLLSRYVSQTLKSGNNMLELIRFLAASEVVGSDTEKHATEAFDAIRALRGLLKSQIEFGASNTTVLGNIELDSKKRKK